MRGLCGGSMILIPNRTQRVKQRGEHGEILDVVVPISADDFTDNEAGLVARFVAEWYGQIRWAEKMGSWLAWGLKPGVWATDDEKKNFWKMVTRSAMAHTLWYSSVDRNTEEARAQVASGLMSPQAGRGQDYCKTTVYRAVLESAKAYLNVALSEFDVDPWELNTPVGVVDLRTGVMWDHDEDHRKYIRVCSVAPTVDEMGTVIWDPESTPVWNGHLAKLCMNRGPDYIEYLRLLVGMSLIGDQSQKKHIVPQMTGRGRNGKGTFIECLSNLLGDYGMKGSTRLLSASTEAHTTEQADLAGKRLVYLEEVKKVNADMLKDLSGGGKHRARFIGKNNFEFQKGFTLWINNNGPMQHDDTSDGLWKRVPKIWFGEGISDGEQIDDFDAWLISEWPGILSWAIQGCLDYQRWGLQTPEGVIEDSKTARADADPLSEVLNEYFERIDCGSGLGTDYGCFKASEFRKIQNAHYKATGENNAGGMRQVYSELRDRLGLRVEMDGRRITWICGIRMKRLTLEQLNTLGEGGYQGNFGELNRN